MSNIRRIDLAESLVNSTQKWQSNGYVRGSRNLAMENGIQMLAAVDQLVENGVVFLYPTQTQTPEVGGGWITPKSQL